MPLPVGKLPVDLLARLLARAPALDPRVVVGPGIGLDCAVIDMGGILLVCKSDPITFATDQIGWYLVQVNANDLATTGATPRWLLATLLLPDGQTTPQLAEQINDQIYEAARKLGISVVGGHTEITHGLGRPILVGTLIGEVERARLVTPQGARPGDWVLLTKGVPIEATAILARELPERLQTTLDESDLKLARDFLFDPGISVLRDAQIAMRTGRVTAMHDPTEGGLAAALWELAEASGRALTVDVSAVPVPPLAARVCQALDIDPLTAIASGALLLTSAEADATAIRRALEAEGLACAMIGRVEAGPPAVWQETPGGRTLLPRPEQDAIARVFAHP